MNRRLSKRGVLDEIERLVSAGHERQEVIERAQHELEEIRAQLEALMSYLDALGIERKDLPGKLDLVPFEAGSRPGPIRANGGSRSRDVHHAVINDVEGVLRERGAPMTVGEIRDAMRSKGLHLPGRGTTSNLTVHLRQAGDRFSWPQRGVYALREWEG
jgi:hypothetical protein